jgi:hypothetical protein
MLRAIQQDVAVVLNLMEIDFESFSIKLRNSRFTIGSEIRGMFYISENTGKSLSREQHLIFLLYAAIFAQRKDIYRNSFKLIANLI